MNDNEKLHGAANRINRNLQHQLLEQKKFGQSKHKAKQKAREDYLQKHGNLKGYNPSKVEGIFSFKTMASYCQTAKEFSVWASNHGCKKASDISRELAGQYLKERQADGKSAWTVSKDMSALNKIFNYDLSKAELGLRNRCLLDITRSRNETSNDSRNFSKYNDQITFAKGTGCRRQSVTKVCPQDCVRNSEGKVVAIRFTEKGGKTRVAPVLNEYKDKVTEVVDKHNSGAGKPLFDTYDSHIDNHAFRSQYATALLHQLESETAAMVALCGGDFDPHPLINLRGKDAETDDPYRGHDRDICGMVSGALGHNRLEIVFQNYLR